MTTREVSLAARLTVARAAVRAGEVETVYWRVGSGETVILLGAHPDGDDLFSAQVVRLAAHHRVIVPEHVTTGALTCANESTRTSFATWLCNFVEGLGVGGAHVVATEAFSGELQRIASETPELFGCLVCLATPEGDTSVDPTAVETTIRGVSYVAPGDEWPDIVTERLQHYAADRS